MPAKLIFQDANNCYFEAETTSFSIFAIVGEKIVAEISKKAEEINVSEEIIEEANLTEAVEKAPEVAEEAIKKPFPAKSLIFIAILIIAVVVYFGYKRKLYSTSHLKGKRKGRS